MPLSHNQNYRADMCEPASNAVAVTPSDTVDLTTPAVSLYIGGAGNVKVDMEGSGVGITFTGALAGSVLPIRVSRVYSTGTSATLIVALF